MKFGTRPATHSFEQTPSIKIGRSQYDLSHTVKSAFDSGWLVPFFAKIAYPGDTFNIKANCFAKLSTPVVPVMDGIFLDTQFWGVPWRLVWSNFQKFMGEQDNPGDSTSYLIPQCTSPSNGYAIGSLQDYFGLQTLGQIGSGKTLTHNNLFLRAYNLIYNTWYRDENMQNSVTVDLGDGPDTYTNYVLKRRGKRKDYLTGSLPFLQKGTPVTLPLGNVAPVGNLAHGPAGANLVYTTPDFQTGAAAGVKPGNTLSFNPTTGQNDLLNFGDTGHNLAPYNLSTHPFSSDTNGLIWDGTTGTYLTYGVPFGNLTADLSSATAATINQLRQAIQLQGYLERDARYGTRYTEKIQGHFGVVSPDSRLQRPEYLGGNTTRLTMTPVAQTSNTPASGTPQGNLAAYGTVHSVPGGFNKSFTEHMLIIGIVSVRCALVYQQGVDREWFDQTIYDMYWPSFAHLGEQAILMREIYCTGDATNDGTVFGYQEQYGHMRDWRSKITGIMKSTAANTLDVYQLAQKFTSAPTLGDTFISENPPIARVQAVNTEPQFLFEAYIDATAARPMPTYGIPATLGGKF